MEITEDFFEALLKENGVDCDAKVDWIDSDFATVFKVVESLVKKSNDIQNVSGIPSFKEQLINNFIPRIEVMEEKERLHLHYLIDIDAPTEFVQKSQQTHFHLIDKIKEYKEYAERL